MIYSVRGKLIAIEQNLAVIECGGVGYACRTTANTLAEIRDEGEEVFLYTYLSVREDGVELFGFADTAELSCFKMLISVSGVGPKAALSILSGFTPSSFALCIASGDSKALTRTPGIGAKIASRIILELKDKIEKQSSISAEEYSAAASPAVLKGNTFNEALSALMVLGFSNQQAASALNGADPDMQVQELIKYGLKRLGG